MNTGPVAEHKEEGRAAMRGGKRSYADELLKVGCGLASEHRAENCSKRS